MDNITSMTIPSEMFLTNQENNNVVQEQNNDNRALIRVTHFSPGTPAIDVYANGKLIAKGLRYGQSTPFVKVSPGRYNIRVFMECDTNGAIVNANVNLSENGKYTLAVIGQLPNIGLQVIPEPKSTPMAGTANIRVIHLSPDAPPVDIIIENDRTIFSRVAFRDITPFITVAPGRYTIKINIAGTKDTVLVLPNIVLSAGRSYTILVIGLVRENPRIQTRLLT